MRILQVVLGYIQANLYCLFHFGLCVLTTYSLEHHSTITKKISVGKGSIYNNTWQEVKQFYP